MSNHYDPAVYSERGDEIGQVNAISHETVENFLLGGWILLYGLVSTGLAKMDGRTSIHDVKNFCIVISVIVIIGFINLSTWFVNNAMKANSLREEHRDAKWYLVDPAAYRKLTPGGSQLKLYQLGKSDDSYICAYFPFSYADKKVLCDPSVVRPDSSQCLVMTEIEARTVLSKDFPTIATCPLQQKRSKN